ncbi:ester cyclase [Nocardia sp. BSTN01]|uniref:ester cyclase n=1 Tax=Nocardia sp. BSTN01 TaxID=2783665 RepID=UPI002814D145|nr:ester cyclase [Nocardia sp. BSTN01]
MFEEFVNKGDFSVVDEIYREDMVDHEPIPGAPDGRVGVKYTIGQLRGAFADLRVVIEDMSAQGDYVVVHNTWHGTHTGELLGIAPTGERIESRGIVVWRLQDGLIAERWAVNVASNMLAQLGMGKFTSGGRSRRAPAITAPGDARTVILAVRPEAEKDWAAAQHITLTERRREYEQSRRRLGIVHEVFAPAGSGAIAVTVQCADPNRLRTPATGPGAEFDGWLRAAAVAAFGCDPWIRLSEVDPAALTWTAPPTAAAMNWATTVALD